MRALSASYQLFFHLGTLAADVVDQVSLSVRGGAAWGLMKDSLAANNTAENIEALLRAARDGGYPVFLSPHYYFPSDRRWAAADPWTPGAKV